MLKGFAEGVPPLELIEEREALFHKLSSTTADKMPKEDTFTIDPSTRYPRFSEYSPPGDISHLYDSDKPKPQAPVQPAKQEKKPPATTHAPGELWQNAGGKEGHYNDKHSNDNCGTGSKSEECPTLPTVVQGESWDSVLYYSVKYYQEYKGVGGGHCITMNYS